MAGTVILSVKNIEDLAAIVTARTAEDRAKFESEKKEDTAEPPQIKKIRDSLDASSLRSHLEGIDTILTALTEMITGKTYSFAKDSDGILYNYRRYTMVVALEKPEGSAYSIDTPFLVTKKLSTGQAAAAMRPKEQGTGNTHKGKWRLATDEEITKFFAELSQESKDELLDAFKE